MEQRYRPPAMRGTRIEPFGEQHIDDAAELVDAWFRVGFGAQHAFGIRELDEWTEPAANGIVVRRGTERDVEALVALGRSLDGHQKRSPVYANPPSWTDEEMRAEIVED